MAKEVAVPYPHKTHQDRQIFGKGRGLKMRIHRRRAIQHAGEPVSPDPDHHRQPHRRPQGIAPAYTLVEIEQARAFDTPVARHLQRGGHRHHARPPAAGPVTGQRGVAHGLGGGEGLRCDDEKRAVGGAAGQQVMKMRRIDVRDVMNARPVAIGCQRGADHGRAKVRATDSDIDHVADIAVAHVIGECRQRGIAAALDPQRGALRHMDNGPSLRPVHWIAGKQRLHLLGKTCFGGKRQQQLDGFGAHLVT